MTCCALLIAATVWLSPIDAPVRVTGGFSTPMFLRGQPVWVTPISRRQLRLRYEYGERTKPAPKTDVATRLA